MVKIGKPVPKGIVDVAHDFVGVPEQNINVRHEIGRLRKQVKLLRRRVKNAGLIPETHSTRYVIAALTAVGVVGLFVGLMGSRRNF